MTTLICKTGLYLSVTNLRNRTSDIVCRSVTHASLSGGNSERVPPDPISNSEVKTLSADDSVGSPHVKVGHCQTI